MLEIYQPSYLSTPVENLFIDEFMGKAPGAFVKVYLYGLRLSLYPMEENPSLDKFSKILDMTTDEVTNAFSYWDRMGLVNFVSSSPLKVTYLSVQQRFLTRNEHKELYRYQELNQELQSMVGAQRLITHEDFQLVYEWVEQLGVQLEAVPSLVKHYLDSKHNKRLSFSYIDKAVRGLVQEKNITTLEQVEKYIHGETLCRPAREVLELWNVHRNATQDEGELWAKWTLDWGFDRSSILVVAKNMTNVSNPNFRYLDKMIESLKDMNIKGLSDIRQYYHTREETADHLSPILRNLGYRGAQSPQIREMYASWRSKGFSQGSLEKMASSLSREGRSRPEDLDALVKRQYKQGRISDEEIDELLRDAEESREAFSELLDAWGENRAPSAMERKSWSQWRALGYSPELIALAAEYSVHAQDKLRYMGAILGGWQEQGITTVEAARADHNESRPEPVKTAHKLEYEKKTRAFDSFFDDVEEGRTE